MGRVGDEQLAAELGAAAAFVPADHHVRAQDEQQERELRVADVDAMGTAHQVIDRLPYQLEARDRQEAHDRQCAERLELPMAVGVILVGLLGGHANDDQREHVVQRIHARVHCAAEDRERSGREPHGDLDPHDRQVGDEEADEHSANLGGRRHGQDARL